MTFLTSSQFIIINKKTLVTNLTYFFIILDLLKNFIKILGEDLCIEQKVK